MSSFPPPSSVESRVGKLPRGDNVREQKEGDHPTESYLSRYENSKEDDFDVTNASRGFLVQQAHSASLQRNHFRTTTGAVLVQESRGSQTSIPNFDAYENSRNANGALFEASAASSSHRLSPILSLPHNDTSGESRDRDTFNSALNHEFYRDSIPDDYYSSNNITEGDFRSNPSFSSQVVETVAGDALYQNAVDDRNFLERKLLVDHATGLKVNSLSNSAFSASTENFSNLSTTAGSGISTNRSSIETISAKWRSSERAPSAFATYTGGRKEISVPESMRGSFSSSSIEKYQDNVPKLTNSQGFVGHNSRQSPRILRVPFYDANPSDNEFFLVPSNSNQSDVSGSNARASGSAKGVFNSNDIHNGHGGFPTISVPVLPPTFRSSPVSPLLTSTFSTISARSIQVDFSPTATNSPHLNASFSPFVSSSATTAQYRGARPPILAVPVRGNFSSRESSLGTLHGKELISLYPPQSLLSHLPLKSLLQLRVLSTFLAISPPIMPNPHAILSIRRNMLHQHGGQVSGPQTSSLGIRNTPIMTESGTLPASLVQSKQNPLVAGESVGGIPSSNVGPGTVYPQIPFLLTEYLEGSSLPQLPVSALATSSAGKFKFPLRLYDYNKIKRQASICSTRSAISQLDSGKRVEMDATSSPTPRSMLSSAPLASTSIRSTSSSKNGGPIFTDFSVATPQPDSDVKQQERSEVGSYLPESQKDAQKESQRSLLQSHLLELETEAEEVASLIKELELPSRIPFPLAVLPPVYLYSGAGVDAFVQAKLTLPSSVRDAAGSRSHPTLVPLGANRHFTGSQFLLRARQFALRPLPQLLPAPVVSNGTSSKSHNSSCSCANKERCSCDWIAKDSPPPPELPLSFIFCSGGSAFNSSVNTLSTTSFLATRENATGIVHRLGAFHHFVAPEADVIYPSQLSGAAAAVKSGPVSSMSHHNPHTSSSTLIDNSRAPVVNSHTTSSISTNNGGNSSVPLPSATHVFANSRSVTESHLASGISYLSASWAPTAPPPSTYVLYAIVNREKFEPFDLSAPGLDAVSGIELSDSEDSVSDSSEFDPSRPNSGTRGGDNDGIKEDPGLPRRRIANTLGIVHVETLAVKILEATRRLRGSLSSSNSSNSGGGIGGTTGSVSGAGGSVAPGALSSPISNGDAPQGLGGGTPQGHSQTTSGSEHFREFIFSTCALPSEAEGLFDLGNVRPDLRVAHLKGTRDASAFVLFDSELPEVSVLSNSALNRRVARSGSSHSKYSSGTTDSGAASLRRTRSSLMGRGLNNILSRARQLLYSKPAEGVSDGLGLPQPPLSHVLYSLGGSNSGLGGSPSLPTHPTAYDELEDEPSPSQLLFVAFPSSKFNLPQSSLMKLGISGSTSGPTAHSAKDDDQVLLPSGWRDNSHSMFISLPRPALPLPLASLDHALALLKDSQSTTKEIMMQAVKRVAKSLDRPKSLEQTLVDLLLNSLDANHGPSLQRGPPALSKLARINEMLSPGSHTCACDSPLLLFTAESGLSHCICELLAAAYRFVLPAQTSAPTVISKNSAALGQFTVHSISSNNQGGLYANYASDSDNEERSAVSGVPKTRIAPIFTLNESADTKSNASNLPSDGHRESEMNALRARVAEVLRRLAGRQFFGVNGGSLSTSGMINSANGTSKETQDLSSIFASTLQLEHSTVTTTSSSLSMPQSPSRNRPLTSLSSSIWDNGHVPTESPLLVLESALCEHFKQRNFYTPWTGIASVAGATGHAHSQGSASSSFAGGSGQNSTLGKWWNRGLPSAFFQWYSHSLDSAASFTDATYRPQMVVVRTLSEVRKMVEAVVVLLNQAAPGVGAAVDFVFNFRLNSSEPQACSATSTDSGAPRSSNALDQQKNVRFSVIDEKMSNEEEPYLRFYQHLALLLLPRICMLVLRRPVQLPIYRPNSSTSGSLTSHDSPLDNLSSEDFISIMQILAPGVLTFASDSSNPLVVYEGVVKAFPTFSPLSIESFTPHFSVSGSLSTRILSRMAPALGYPFSSITHVFPTVSGHGNSNSAHSSQYRSLSGSQPSGAQSNRISIPASTLANSSGSLSQSQNQISVRSSRSLKRSSVAPSPHTPSSISNSNSSSVHNKSSSLPYSASAFGLNVAVSPPTTNPLVSVSNIISVPDLNPPTSDIVGVESRQSSTGYFPLEDVSGLLSAASSENGSGFELSAEAFNKHIFASSMSVSGSSGSISGANSASGTLSRAHSVSAINSYAAATATGNQLLQNFGPISSRSGSTDASDSMLIQAAGGAGVPQSSSGSMNLEGSGTYSVSQSLQSPLFNNRTSSNELICSDQPSPCPVSVSGEFLTTQLSESNDMYFASFPTSSTVSLSHIYASVDTPVASGSSLSSPVAGTPLPTLLPSSSLNYNGWNSRSTRQAAPSTLGSIHSSFLPVQTTGASSLSLVGPPAPPVLQKYSGVFALRDVSRSGPQGSGVSPWLRQLQPLGHPVTRELQLLSQLSVPLFPSTPAFLSQELESHGGASKLPNGLSTANTQFTASKNGTTGRSTMKSMRTGAKSDLEDFPVSIKPISKVPVDVPMSYLRFHFQSSQPIRNLSANPSSRYHNSTLPPSTASSVHPPIPGTSKTNGDANMNGSANLPPGLLDVEDPYGMSTLFSLLVPLVGVQQAAEASKEALRLPPMSKSLNWTESALQLDPTAAEKGGRWEVEAQFPFSIAQVFAVAIARMEFDRKTS